jgi:hypothetical protein
VPNIPSQSRGLADENKKTFDEMEMIRNKRIGFALSDTINMSCTIGTNVCIFVREFSKVFRHIQDLLHQTSNNNNKYKILLKLRYIYK